MKNPPAPDTHLNKPTNRIKTLKFITLFAVGGTERQFVYLTKGLDRSRFDVRVGCHKRSGTFLQDLEALNIPISEYPIKSMYSYRTLRRQLKLARDIRQQGIQIVHAYGFYPNIFTIPAARLAGDCVTVASVRDVGLFSSQKRLKIMAQKMVCRIADCVLANSEAARQWLVAEGIHPDRIRVIRNGIVIPNAEGPGDCPIRTEFGIDRNAPIVSVVCRLTRTKGLEFFLDAAPAVAARFPAVRFLIVGDTHVEKEYKAELQKRAASLNLTDRVIFTGQRNDVARILRETTLSVLPSLSESFSNSLLEAMAAGLPVVTTTVGGNPEIVLDRETGILVPPRDPAALCRAMVHVLESPDLGRTLGQAGRERVTRNFSLESTLRATEDLYETLIEQRGIAGKR